MEPHLTSIFTRYPAMLGIVDKLSFSYDDTPRSAYDGFHWICWRPTRQFKDKPEDMAAVLQQPILGQLEYKQASYPYQQWQH